MAAIYFQQSSGLDEEFRQQLVSSILQSNLFGPSALGREFVNTNGFSLVFKREYLAVVAANFPYISDLLDVAIFPESNAFYLNSLVLNENSVVDEHVDCRFIPATGARILPTLVSVYYAEIDRRMQGGSLVFVTEGGEARVKPQRNAIIHFVGSTPHYISKIRSPCRRVSVVIEQYNLDPENLGAFPDCHLVRNDPDASIPTRN
jgi:hypothetical protein